MFKGYNSQSTGFGTILVVFYLMCKLIKPTICSKSVFEVVMAMKQIYSLNVKLIGFRYFSRYFRHDRSRRKIIRV